ncbi:FG-GAP repeat protein [Streptomyces caniscabiei]|uniref:FG-GAP repeat protein n=1 Tax=Streptomyces caniscabiei TaxID=2746961 RepID=UPI00211AC621|nr:FG-GAP repeat protein [Streptomyces caniscabiei]
MHRRTYALAAASVATATATTAALALTLAPAATAAPRTAPGAPSAAVTSDFNADGYADLAVGVPDGTVNGKAKAGYVHLLWGGAKGLGRHGGIRVSQSTAEVPGTPEAGDRFGASVLLADLSGDGLAELIVGAPGEDVPAGARTRARSPSSAARGPARARPPPPSPARRGTRRTAGRSRRRT